MLVLEEDVEGDTHWDAAHEVAERRGDLGNLEIIEPDLEQGYDTLPGPHPCEGDP